jgi:VanZ family protein
MVSQSTSDHQRMRPARLELRAWQPRVRFSLLMGLGALALVVAYYGLISPTPLPDHRLIVGWNDVLLHVAAFFALTLVALALFVPIVRVCLVVFALGIGIEIVQLASAYHEPSLRDVLANGAGVVLALAVFGATSWAWPRLSGTALPGPVKTE